MTQKLYCYVDETGQDTKGRLYIVVAVLTDMPRERFYEVLTAAEHDSGKGKRKWHHNSTQKRDAYIAKAIIRTDVPLRLYYEVFEGEELSIRDDNRIRHCECHQFFCAAGAHYRL